MYINRLVAPPPRSGRRLYYDIALRLYMRDSPRGNARVMRFWPIPETMIRQTTNTAACVRVTTRWRRLARAAVAVSVLLAGQIGVARAALGMDCPRAESRPAGARIGVPANESGSEGKPAGLPAAFSGAPCQVHGSLRPDSPALADAAAPKSDPLIEADRTARSDWRVPPPFHPPRHS